MRKGGIIFLLLILTACAFKSYHPYQPNPSQVMAPKETIKKILESQPPSYAYVPVKVEVSEENFTVYHPPNLGHFYPGVGQVLGSFSANLIPTKIFYEHIAQIDLYKDGEVWLVELSDQTGAYLYEVFAYKETDAKRFIDAVVKMRDAE